MLQFQNKTPAELKLVKGLVLFDIFPKWFEQTYYIVEVAFNANNPIHKKIFFSGFLHGGKPCGYNGFAAFGRNMDTLEFQDAYFIRPIKIIYNVHP